MKLNTSQKIWLGLLGLGVCAFGYDVFAGGDAPAEAAVLLTPDATPADARPGVVPTADAPAAVSFATWLSTLASDAPAAAPDAFATPGSWAPAQVAPPKPDEELAKAFLATHTLRAVFESGGVGRAMVNERLLLVGQSLDGFTLAGVDELRATFRRGEATIVLSMKDAALGRSANVK